MIATIRNPVRSSISLRYALIKIDNGFGKEPAGLCRRTGDETMYQRIFVTSILVVCVVVAALPAIAQQKKPITNADIVAMVKAQFPESTIVVAIQQSPPNFDTSPQALIELKAQGVSPKVIEAMLQAGAPTTAASPLPQPQTNNPLSNQQPASSGAAIGGIVLIDPTGRTEMKYSSLEARADIGMMNVVNPFKSTKSKATLNGNHAKLRTTTTSPTFEASIASNANPTDQLVLVKLKPKSDRREIETGRAGIIGGVSTGFKKDDIVPISIEEISEPSTSGSFYKRYSIKTVNPLPPGEYALVAGFYYDFGVDSTR